MDYRYQEIELSSIQINYRVETLKLKKTWSISRASDDVKKNFILDIQSDGKSYQSEIAPNLRYGESQDKIESDISKFKKLDKVSIDRLLRSDFSQSSKSAFTNLILKFLCGNNKQSISEALIINQAKNIMTSFSIPLMEVSEVRSYLLENHQYHCYKLKVCNGEDLDLLNEVLKWTDKKIRIDANEGFQTLESYLEFEKNLPFERIELIEQPFKAADIKLYEKLKPISRFKIIADESLINEFDPIELKKQFHGVNIKQMKAGGILRSFELIQKAREANLEVMLGCMIESSMGISEALILAPLCDYIDLDGALLTSNDPFSGLVLEKKGFLTNKS